MPSCHKYFTLLQIDFLLYILLPFFKMINYHYKWLIMKIIPHLEEWLKCLKGLFGLSLLLHIRLLCGLPLFFSLSFHTFRSTIPFLLSLEPIYIYIYITIYKLKKERERERRGRKRKIEKRMKERKKEKITLQVGENFLRKGKNIRGLIVTNGSNTAVSNSCICSPLLFCLSF